MSDKNNIFCTNLKRFHFFEYGNGIKTFNTFLNIIL